MMTASDPRRQEQPLTELKPVSQDAADPVAQNQQGFWFWDETWSEAYGPYPTEGRARAELERYGHWLDTGEVLPAPIPAAQSGAMQ